MLRNETIEKLKTMRLPGFVEALEEQYTSSVFEEMSFEERLGLLVDREQRERLIAYNACCTRPSFKTLKPVWKISITLLTVSSTDKSFWNLPVVSIFVMQVTSTSLEPQERERVIWDRLWGRQHADLALLLATYSCRIY